jgi:limonene-1,2-epoxide hydrolase
MMMTIEQQEKRPSVGPISFENSFPIVIDTTTGKTGTYADWVDAFVERWAAAKDNLDRFMDILGHDVVLRAPGLKTTRGREAGYRAFAGTFAALPDITGKILRWSASGEVLFIEMAFTATIGGKLMTWSDVDRFVFRDGIAVERTAFFDPTRIRRAYLGSLLGWKQLWLIRQIR